MTTAPGRSDGADALAQGLAAHLRRWALARGAAAADAEAAAAAGQALSLAMGDGHVCVWLHDLTDLVERAERDVQALAPGATDADAARDAPVGDEAAAPSAAWPADAAAWRRALLDSRLVGTATAPDNQPLVLDADGRLYLHRQFDLERRLARRLLRAATPVAADAATDALRAQQLAALFRPRPGDPPDWQMLAAALALQRRLTVVSGGPGTGKTTTVVNLLACLLAEAPDTRVVLAAPTGKAAARLAEALRDRAGHLDAALRARLPAAATTVHRLLGVRSGRGGIAGAGERAFRHGPDQPLPLDLLVLDEASMLDLALATRLLEAVPPHARVVLLGDKDQLAAVEAGAVFAELSADPTLSPAVTARLARLCGLASDAVRPPAPAQPGALPDSVVWFQRNYRFARDSGIGRLAADTLAGDAAAVVATLRDAAAMADGLDAAVAWLADGDDRPAEATLAAAAQGYAAYADACRAALQHPVGDTTATVAALHAAFGRFRVLCAVRQGPRGVDAVNAVLGQRLRAAITGSAADTATGLAADMAAMRQPWHAGRPVMVLRNDPGLRLFNGDIGLTLPAADGTLQVWFPSSDGGWRAVPPARLPAHETAWAMTVHKSQGSEFEAVLLLLPAQRSRVLSRELLYTAITRARRRVQVAAGAGVLAAAVLASSQRHAGLQARLRELASAAGATADR